MIIDIRGNGGGSDTYWCEAFVSPNITEEKYVHSCYLYNEETIENELTKPFIEEIHPYLFEEKMGLEELPESISLNLNGNQFATLVGEPDNGDNCNGDPFLFSLPNSGMIIRFDLFYGVNIDGTCNAISGCQPDIECISQEALQTCIERIR